MIVAPKFCISIVFSVSWELKWPQEKLKTMLMQNFGVTNKEHYGMLWYFWSGQFQKETMSQNLSSENEFYVHENKNSCSDSWQST